MMAEVKQQMLYFSYGSNLNIEQMRARCVDAQPVCAYRLANWRLEFRGYADIAPMNGAVVEGAIYRISRHDVAVLDRYEGIDAREPFEGLYRRHWLDLEVDGAPSCALVYLMNTDSLHEPAQDYFECILQGFADWQLPTDSLYQARERASSAAQKLTVTDKQSIGQAIA